MKSIVLSIVALVTAFALLFGGPAIAFAKQTDSAPTAVESPVDSTKSAPPGTGTPIEVTPAPTAPAAPTTTSPPPKPFAHAPT